MPSPDQSEWLVSNEFGQDESQSLTSRTPVPVERIAIVGVGGIFPGAPDLDTFWTNVLNGVDSGQNVPSNRWFLSPEKGFDSDGPKPDRVYSRWGCFIEGFQFDPTGLNLDQGLLTRLDPLFHLGLHAARAALFDARGLGRTNLGRVGVILGNIVLPTESTSAMCRDVLGRTFLERLIETAPLSARQREHLISKHCGTSEDGHWHPLNRFAASLPAALIAKGLGLGGVAYTLDAACASSLYALKFACEELLAHRADAMLAGGMSRPDCQYTQMGFAQLKALSRSGRCAPLSADADGLVVGEGAGIFVLKRLSDAISAGDRIYGTIAGIGLSNDRGANLLAPHSEGQLRAMRAAYRQAGWHPSDVDLIECHATGTPVGDAVEIESLHQLWYRESSRSGQCVIGGVKSNVGHLLTGAGAAGLMKVLYAIKHQTLPPTANYQRPAEAMARANSPFRVLSHAEPWHRRETQVHGGLHPTLNQTSLIPRRATINAFGFGGINAHVLIEEFIDGSVQVPTNLNFGSSIAPPIIDRDTAPGTTKSFIQATESLEIAIIGFAVQTSADPSIAEFRDQAVTGLRGQQKVSIKDWGVDRSQWFQNEFASNGEVRESTVAGIKSVSLPLGEFRIPPIEMQDMLPQQQLMLKVTANALRESRRGQSSGNLPIDSTAIDDRTGVFIGIELDPNTTNFHFRWSIEQQAEQWAESLGMTLSPVAMSEWIGQLKDSVSPPLSANRVMGNLGGIVASRLAREFNVGGPSFTISADENSGLRALEMAAHALHRRELDRAIVGAVDLPSDIRSTVAAMRTDDGLVPGQTIDGATAFVLKRFDDAMRNGDVVHAVIRRIGAPRGEATKPRSSTFERAGAATGLLNVTAAVVALSEQMESGRTPQYWLHNQADGERRIDVQGRGTDGRGLSVELVEFAGSASQKPYGPNPSSQRIVSRSANLFVIDGDSTAELERGLKLLSERVDSNGTTEQLARRWFQELVPRASRQFAVTLIIRTIDEIPDVIRIALARLRNESIESEADRRINFSRQPLGRDGRLAFVFPGSGNAFLGMGRELFFAFPDILRGQEIENRRLRDQYHPDLIWNGASTADLLRDHKGMIFGQVALGTAICDLLARFSVRPTASIGYSLGESAALFGLRAWTDRDEMLRRMEAATLFGSDLVQPFDAARRAWNVPKGIEVPWISGAIDRSSGEVRAAIAGIREFPIRVYLLIVNTPNQCVIGGDRDQIERVVTELSATFVPFAAASTVHCEILRQVESAYRELHLMRTTSPTFQPTMGAQQTQSGTIDFYSTASGHPYDLTRESAAEAIVAQAIDTIDFPRVIERAYADGVRLFVEIGPGSSCTRMIDEILGERVHFARAATPVTADAVTAFIELLAVLISERVPIDLEYLYGHNGDDEQSAVTNGSRREIVTEVGGKPFQIPVPVGGWQISSESEDFESRFNNVFNDAEKIHRPEEIDRADKVRVVEEIDAARTRMGSRGTTVMTQLDDMLAARVKAHEAYLKVSAEAQRIMAEQIARLSRLANGEREESGVEAGFALQAPDIIVSEQPQPQTVPSLSALESNTFYTLSTPPRSLSRAQCMEFAIGRIDRALGPTFAGIDQNPTRVRLPDEPLMLVDRILDIEGEPLSMTFGRVITEHDIQSGAWYLDGNRIPTCIAVEAGQADLFLSGWLGIDLQTKGLACYRLLDAVVTFHRELPQPGKTIHYDIRINHFFRQGQTYLFRFEFDATVDGQPLLTMREGCAGFFTEAELAGGKGIVHTALDRQPRPGKRTADFSELVSISVESYDDSQLLELRRGRLDACFGNAFARLPVINPMTLPGLGTGATAAPRSRMWLIDRVLKLDPHAGKFGLGMILGELDIHPDDWFLTCHFCDDQVMPGTLMYECCMHTLRIYLLRMGWIGESGQTVYEPIPGIRSRLKCRGQVRANTRKVWYEITLKEIGYTESGVPYCIADALMYGDGKPIVEITDMSVRLSGLTQESVERLWNQGSQRIPNSFVTAAIPAFDAAVKPIHRPYDRRPALFDTDRITAFAIGNPSEAFGDRYRVFDSLRTIARLPGPPFQFLDRIVSIAGCEPWVLKAGGEVVAQYDVTPDAWYFASNRQRRMPFAVLLETALQPCGWLAAYVGSALTSDTDLSFRNLGGTASQFRDVTAESGTLTTTVKMTRVSNSGGMIIQHYDFDLRCDGESVYVGNTYFGFFSKASLANQIGIRDAKPFAPSSAEATRTQSFPYIDAAPFADSQFQMIDDVQLSLMDGPFGHGFVIGTTTVDPSSWFFKAHFHQDPVVPGSLGLESFFQLVKLYAAHRWQVDATTQFATPIVQHTGESAGQKHEWVYRGQVIPSDRVVTVSAVIKQVDDTARELIAEGFLSVDGRIIYQMKDFSLRAF